MKLSNPLKTALLSVSIGCGVLGLTSTSAVAQTNPATTTFASLRRYSKIALFPPPHWDSEITQELSTPPSPR